MPTWCPWNALHHFPICRLNEKIESSQLYDYDFVVGYSINLASASSMCSVNFHSGVSLTEMLHLKLQDTWWIVSTLGKMTLLVKVQTEFFLAHQTLVWMGYYYTIAASASATWNEKDAQWCYEVETLHRYFKWVWGKCVKISCGFVNLGLNYGNKGT